MVLTLAEIAAYTGGSVYGQSGLEVAGVQIDSRRVKSGDLFAALKGEQTDGHNYVFKALTEGTAALVEKTWAESNQAFLPPGRALVAVSDPQAALQQLAKRYRQKFALPVIGVSGSSGKTTTKDMIAAVLAEKLVVHKTRGNFNNELGLPLTLLGLEAGHQAAVVEMGMRGLGEISFLASLAKPNVGVITNIGTTHMELLGSQENIARAKGELLQMLPADGTAVLNGDDPWCRRLGEGLICRVIYYSLNDPKADLTAQDVTPWGERGISFRASYLNQTAEVLLPLPGRHNAYNALAAIGAGLSLGLDLESCARGLRNLQLTGMRLEICPGLRGSRIIDDTYNANPASTRAALEVLAGQSAGLPKVAVLGSMFELGPEEENGHRMVGSFAAGIPGMAYLVTVGELARLIARGALEAGMEEQRVFSFADTAEASNFLRQSLPPDAWVLVKGSRGMKMERIVQELKIQA